MNHADILKRRADPSGRFIILKDAHVTIGGSRAAGITYAALELLAFADGFGDTKPMDVTVSEIQVVEGPLHQNRETILASIRLMLKTNVLTAPQKRGRDNRYRLQLNWPKICERIGLPENQQPTNKTVAGKPATDQQNGSRKTGIPNKEVRDLGGLRDRWGNSSLEAQIESALGPFSKLFAESWSKPTVLNLSKAFRAKPDPDELVRQLGVYLAGIAAGRLAKPKGWGAVVWRARTWECSKGQRLPVRLENAEWVNLVDLRPMRKPPGSENDLPEKLAAPAADSVF